MAIVKSRIPGSRHKFDTRYCVQTQEEIDAIIQEVCDKFVQYYIEEQRAKIAQEQKAKQESLQINGTR